MKTAQLPAKLGCFFRKIISFYPFSPLIFDTAREAGRKMRDKKDASFLKPCALKSFVADKNKGQSAQRDFNLDYVEQFENLGCGLFRQFS